MPQIYLSSQDIQGESFTIRSTEAHHLIHVLRANPKDKVQLFDGQGHQYSGVIESVDKKECIVQGRITNSLPIKEKSLSIHLYQGLPKGSKFDFIIEKSVELGVASITPFLSQKNIIKLESQLAQKKQERWQRLALAAAKQCGRPDVPVVNSVFSFSELESRFRDQETWALFPEASIKLKSILAPLKENKGNVNVIVGPESGFHKDEIELLKNWRVKLVSLGKNILRTETAPITFISILQYEIGEL